MGVHVKIAGAWQEIGASGGGGVPWAKVSGGTVTEVTNADGSVDEVHTFPDSGSLTVESPGYARVLACSEGGYANGGPGNGAQVIEGIYNLPAGALPVVVTKTSGDIGSAAGIMGVVMAAMTPGTPPSSKATGAGSGYTSNPTDGYTSSISGTATVYGPVGDLSKFGGGAPAGPAAFGAKGIVIVRVQKSAPTVSGVAATGGTITEYTGDGTNGVAGQKYKVHTFLSDGSFVASNGGVVDVCVVGGGGGGGLGGGGGGFVLLAKAFASAGANPVVVGSGGAVNPVGAAVGESNGGPSSAFGIIAIGGGYGGSGSNDTNEGRSATGGNGGCGGGAGSYRDSTGYIGVGYQYDGGNPHRYDYGTHWGGGGAGMSGNGTPASQDTGGNGGAGITVTLGGTPLVLGGGGGGGHQGAGSANGGVGGAGGGGNQGVAGTPNTGGGGGAFAAGGSGIVIVRYEID